jgi:hypothetical protein
MPILNPHTVTPCLSKQLATSSQRCLHARTRCLHETAAADSVQGQSDLEQHVNAYAPPLRARKHGFKPLPMSPLMREGYAKGRPRPKEQQQDALKDFQKEVAMNPYGTHMPRSYFSRQILTLSPSTSASYSNSPLRSNPRAPPITLPPPFRNNDRETTGCHERPIPQIKSPHPAWPPCRLYREYTCADELCFEPERRGPPFVAAETLGQSHL